MTVKIITDGSADMPQGFFETNDIEQVPLTVSFGEEQYSSDMDNKQFYQKIKSSPKLPMTSSPSPYTFTGAYERAGKSSDILVLALSSGVSSTYQHAKLAADAWESEGGSIEVIDTRTASVGLGLLTYKAALLAREGKTLQQISHAIRDYQKRLPTHIFLETLENVIKGGRLDKVRGTIASVLNVKLLMKATEDGTIDVMEKVRGSQNALRRMIEKIEDAKLDFETAVLAIAHSNCEARAKELLEAILKRYPFKDTHIAEMGPVIGTYAGEDGIVISYL